MPDVIRDFNELYPEIEYELDLSIRPVDLLADPFDLVVRFGHQPDSGVISRQIASVSLGLYASADYLARHGTPVVPSELSQHECLRSSTSKADSIWTLASGGKVEKIPVSGRLSINSVIMLQRMALQGRSEEHTSELQSLMRISY